MMVAFVAVENPAGVLGFKQKGILDDAGNAPKPFPQETEKNVSNVAGKESFYKARFQELQKTKDEWFPKGIARDLLADAQTNERTVQDLIKAVKTIPAARVLMCSSVNSLTKYIANYCLANGATIDTLILFGHGGTDSMNVGLGRIGCFDIKDIDEPKVLKGRQTLGLADDGRGKPPRVREISVDNHDHWGRCFATLQPYATSRLSTGSFHVFLLACDLASEPNAKPQNMLVNVTKFVLEKVLDPLDVVVATPKESVSSDELLTLVKNIDKYCYDAASGNFSIDDVKFESSEGSF